VKTNLSETKLCLASVEVANFGDICETEHFTFTDGHTSFTRNHSRLAIHAESGCVIMHDTCIIVVRTLVYHCRSPCILVEIVCL